MARGSSNNATTPTGEEVAGKLVEAFADNDVLDMLAEHTGLERDMLITSLGAAMAPRPVPEFGDDNEVPEPRDGFGWLVIESPLDVVSAFAALHPAERETMALQASGKLKQALWEMGRLRGGAIDADTEPVALAVVAKPR